MAMLGVSLAQSDQHCYDKYGMLSCTQCDNPPMKCYGCAPGYVTKKDNSGCIKCDDNCYSCTLNKDNVSTTCDDCLKGFIKADNSLSGDCDACGDFCMNCTYESAGDQKCRECLSGGYVVSKLNNANCLPCGSNCVECIAASDDAITCRTCIEGYYVKDKSCSSCPSNCLACSESGGKVKCESCRSKFHKNDDDSACLPCQSACKDTKCAKGAPTNLLGFAKCSECNEGNYLQDDVCTGCFSNCATCTSATECTKCDDGFYLDSPASCLPCDFKCKTCTSATDCSDCEAGYALKKDTDVVCDPCPSSCDTCSISGAVKDECQTCSSGYYRTLTAKCSKCKNNCATCSPGFGICSNCDSGYYLADDDLCYKHITNCQSGHSYNTTVSKSYCTSCDQGFYLNDEKTSCTACGIPGCFGYCSFNSSLTSTECHCSDGNPGGSANERGDCTAGGFVCDEGYFYDSQGTGNKGLPTCVACTTANCKECNSTTQACIKCKSGYAEQPDSTGICQDCGTGCTTCTYDESLGTAKCTACDQGYYLSADKCSSCSSLCSTCSSDTACIIDKCPTGCSGCSPNAAFNGHICSSCSAGFALKSEIGQDDSCTPCPANCNVCKYENGILICSSDNDCATGFGRKKDSQCYACPPNCESCSADANDVLVCSKCVTKFVKNTKFCSPCSSNCATCQLDSGSVIAKEAAARYFVTTEKTCSACSSSCAKCSASGCSECDAGYGLATDKSCVVCSTLTKVDNCLLCDDAQSDGNATCTACASGYFLADDNSFCNLTSLLGPHCTDIKDLGPECEGCVSGEGWQIDVSILPMRCAMECKSCGSTTIDANGNEVVTGDPAVCNPEENINITGTTMCNEGACRIFVKYNGDEEETQAYRGCASNVTQVREIVASNKDIKNEEERNEKAQSTCILDENQKKIQCEFICFGKKECNKDHYGAAGTVYASLMVVMGALVYSFSLTL